MTHDDELLNDVFFSVNSTLTVRDEKRMYRLFFTL